MFTKPLADGLGLAEDPNTCNWLCRANPKDPLAVSPVIRSAALGPDLYSGSI